MRKLAVFTLVAMSVLLLPASRAVAGESVALGEAQTANADCGSLLDLEQTLQVSPDWQPANITSCCAEMSAQCQTSCATRCGVASFTCQSTLTSCNTSCECAGCPPPDTLSGASL